MVQNISAATRRLPFFDPTTAAGPSATPDPIGTDKSDADKLAMFDGLFGQASLVGASSTTSPSLARTLPFDSSIQAYLIDLQQQLGSGTTGAAATTSTDEAATETGAANETTAASETTESDDAAPVWLRHLRRLRSHAAGTTGTESGTATDPTSAAANPSATGNSSLAANLQSLLFNLRAAAPTTNLIG